jgi:hypothetical protein
MGDEEPIGDYISRIWVECREKVGIEIVFLNWALREYPEVVKEFVAFDEMMSGD